MTPPRRRRRWLVSLGVVGGLLAVLLGMGWTLVSGYRAERLRTALDRSDPGWRLTELLAARDFALPPDEDNPVRIAARCRPLLAAGYDPWEHRVINVYGPADWWGAMLPANVRPHRLALADARCTLGECGPAVELARRAGRCPRPGGQTLALAKDLVSTNFGYIHDLSSAERLLANAATVAACDGDPDLAVADAAGIVRLARSAGNEPVTFGFQCRAVALDWAIDATERTLALGEPTVGLAELQADVWAEADGARLTDDLRCQRASFDALCVAVRSGTLTAAELAHVYAVLDIRRTPAAAWAQARTAAADHAMTLRAATAGIELARQPHHLRPPLAAAFAEVPDDLRYPIARAVRDVFDKMDKTDRILVARLRAAAVGLACERFRRQHGRWPAALDELGPLLPAVPLDPTDGRPLRFARAPDGIVVYALGPDGTDDGGKLSVLGLPPGTDVGFQLYDPAHRNRPHPEDGP